MPHSIELIPHNENDYIEAHALSSSAVMFYMYTCHSNYTFKAGNGCGFALTAAQPFYCWCVVWVFCFVLSLNGIVLTQRAPLSLGCMIYSSHWELKSNYTTFYAHYHNKHIQYMEMPNLLQQFKLIKSKQWNATNHMRLKLPPWGSITPQKQNPISSLQQYSSQKETV